MQQPAGHGPSSSVITAAVVQFLWSLPFLYVCGTTLYGTVWVTHELKGSPILLVVLGLPLLFSLVAVMASIGLLWCREWARRMTLCLATFPVLGCILFLIFYHPQVAWGPGQTIDNPYDVTRPIGKISLVILTPVSIWWWALFTRDSVRSQFRRD